MCVCVCVEVNPCKNRRFCKANEVCKRLSLGVHYCECKQDYVNISGTCVGQFTSLSRDMTSHDVTPCHVTSRDMAVSLNKTMSAALVVEFNDMIGLCV